MLIVAKIGGSSPALTFVNPAVTVCNSIFQEGDGYLKRNYCCSLAPDTTYSI
ncbi:MAG: hypothetical protein IPN22_13705 [Bacteroidetes bacterium]|nr:hypothetical protein [Bacteroidota bacterium]